MAEQTQQTQPTGQQTKAQPVAGQTQETQPTEEKKSVWSKWWLWLIIALVVIGIGVGVYFLVFA